MSDIPAFCAAFGSFHVKSSLTSFVIVLVTVRVLPFFLIVTFSCSSTLMVSTFGVRSYTDQRYCSMQVSTTRHSSGVSTELTAPFVSLCRGSGVLVDATCTDGVSGRGIGCGSGKAASTIAASVTETPSSPIAVTCGASTGSESTVIAQPTSVAAPVFSMSEPKPTSPPATQLARTTVPHNAANAASRCGLITFSLPVLSDPHLHQRAFFGSKYGHQELGEK